MHQNVPHKAPNWSNCTFPELDRRPGRPRGCGLDLINPRPPLHHKHSVKIAPLITSKGGLLVDERRVCAS